MFSPISTLKPSRLSSSATSRASLIGSLSGASASGYLALPMTSAKRSARVSAATDRLTGATTKIEITSNAKQIFMRQRSSQQGADPSLRLGDLTLRKMHYQTGVTTRQLLVESGLSRQLIAVARPSGHVIAVIGRFGVERGLT